jgi:hypothetical protein
MELAASIAIDRQLPWESAVGLRAQERSRAYQPVSPRPAPSRIGSVPGSSQQPAPRGPRLSCTVHVQSSSRLQADPRCLTATGIYAVVTWVPLLFSPTEQRCHGTGSIPCSRDRFFIGVRVIQFNINKNTPKEKTKRKKLKKELRKWSTVVV